MCKCSILTAIASGYAGRDPQGGFAIEAFTFFFIEIVMKTKREFFSVFKLKKMEKESYVKVRKKTVE